MTNAQSKHMETKTIVIDLSKYINSENIIKDMARDMAKEIAKDIKQKDIRFCEYCNIGLSDEEYFTVDDQETMCEDCMELHYEWCPEKGDMVKKITTEDINNWKGWSEEDKELLKKLNEDDGDKTARDIML